MEAAVGDMPLRKAFTVECIAGIPSKITSPISVTFVVTDQDGVQPPQCCFDVCDRFGNTVSAPTCIACQFVFEEGVPFDFSDSLVVENQTFQAWPDSVLAVHPAIWQGAGYEVFVGTANCPNSAVRCSFEVKVVVLNRTMVSNEFQEKVDLESELQVCPGHRAINQLPIHSTMYTRLRSPSWPPS